MSEFPSPSTEKKQIITIGGRPGSGKSTAAKAVASELRFGHFSSGDRFRELTQQLGIDELMDANRHAEADRSIDDAVDKELRDLGKYEDERVVDSRLAWFWMPESFKVYLDLDLLIGAQRIIADKIARHKEDVPADAVEYAAVLGDRLQSENTRYMNLYGVDPGNMANYDLVIDSSLNNPDQVKHLVISGFRSWHES